MRCRHVVVLCLLAFEEPHIISHKNHYSKETIHTLHVRERNELNILVVGERDIPPPVAVCGIKAESLLLQIRCPS